MLHPLESKIAQLRRLARRRLVVYGLSWFVAAGLGAAALLATADYLIRFRDPGVRVILTLTLVAVLVWASYRFLYRAVTVRLSDVDLARRLQRRFPELNDGLASAIEFLKQSEDDPTAGSPELRRAVISRTTADVEPLEFADAINRRPARRAAIVAVAACLVVGIVAAVDPLTVQIAVARLASPLGKVAWPREYYLKMKDRVDRVALGQAFEIEVVDAFGSELPSNTRIFYRFQRPDGSTADESEPMRPRGDAMIARRENVTRPFSYHIEGGDDHAMEWIPVDVVQPPSVASLSVTLAPPEYTGWAATKTDGHIRALAGTRATIEGAATAALASAAVCFDDGRTVAGTVSNDGLHFTIPAATGTRADKSPTPPGESLVLDKSGTYWLRLVDREGMTSVGGERWDIRVVPDQPPSVAIEEPGDTVFVTPTAEVPLRVAAKDDLAIHRIDLVVEPPGDSPSKPTQRTISIYAGSDRVAPRTNGGPGDPDGGESRVVEYRWDLTDLKLAPGVQATFYATATDYRPQSGKSEPRRLVVITPEQLVERLGQQQRLLVTELTRALELERQSRGEAAKVETRLKERSRLEQLDIDHLQGADLLQRQAARVLTSATDGVPRHIESLLRDLANNKVDSPEISQRMEGLREDIQSLGREHLDPIARELTAAIKTAQTRLEEPSNQTKGPDVATEASLATAGEHQARAVEALDKMIARLSELDNYRRFHREIVQLAKKQEELFRGLIEVGQRTLGKDAKDLRPEDVAQLTTAGRDQLELGRLLDRLLQEMDQTRQRLIERDPPSAEILRRAVACGRELGTSNRMRAAGERAARNQTGQAAELQRQTLEDLLEILEILANRQDRQLVRVEEAVKKLHERQDAALDATRRIEASRPSDGRLADAEAARLTDVAREQRLLQEETSRLGARAGGVFQLALFRAGTEMARAAGWLDRGRTGQPAQEAQQAALSRLAMLIEALKPEPPQPNAQASAAQPGAGQGGQTSTPPPPSTLPPLAQLKLLKMLQEDLAARTDTWAKQYGGMSPLSDAARRQQEELATEQGQLAELLLQFLPPQEGLPR